MNRREQVLINFVKVTSTMARIGIAQLQETIVDRFLTVVNDGLIEDHIHLIASFEQYCENPTTGNSHEVRMSIKQAYNNLPKCGYKYRALFKRRDKRKWHISSAGISQSLCKKVCFNARDMSWTMARWTNQENVCKMCLAIHRDLKE